MVRDRVFQKALGFRRLVILNFFPGGLNDKRLLERNTLSLVLCAVGAAWLLVTSVPRNASKVITVPTKMINVVSRRDEVLIISPSKCE